MDFDFLPGLNILGGSASPQQQAIWAAEQEADRKKIIIGIVGLAAVVGYFFWSRK